MVDNDFSYVQRDLLDYRAGAPKRREISDAIQAFKKEVEVAVCQNGLHATFDGDMAILQRCLHGTSFSEEVKIQGECTLHITPLKRIHFFRYKMDAARGYPVVMYYGEQNVECQNKVALMAAIKEAYENKLPELSRLY